MTLVFTQAFIHPSCDRLTTTCQIRKRKRATTTFMANSLFEPIDNSLLGASLTARTTAFDVTSSASTTTFEPILNVPALVTFLFITTVFTALILRTNQVETAVQTRKQRLEELRKLKSKEIFDGTVRPEDVQQVLQLYEDAVIREEDLRNILPGVRIVPPSSNNLSEGDASLVAKQLLGKEYKIGVPKPDNDEKLQNDSESSGKLSAVAIGILFMLMFSQVGLLTFLNFGFDTSTSLL